MRRLVVLFGIVVFFAGCAEPAKEQIRRAERMRRELQEIALSLDYIRDSRTGLCFAYYWGGAGNGGPALATVPCGAIPASLLPEERGTK